MYNGDLCLGCMNPLDGRKECRHCGYIAGTPRTLPCLEPGTVLANRYLIGRHLRMNGEGITYIALDRKTNRRVDVREYLPRTFSTRRADNDAVVVRKNAHTVFSDYLADFMDVSRAVSRLVDEPAIVPLINLFESNNTAYAVYEHVEGKTLAELVRRAGRLDWDREAEALFEPLVRAVSAAHSVGLVHFAISPECILMTRSGHLVLTNFGIPDGRIAETELEAELHEGFAALEQYSLDARKGKWSDVYSMCAVILYALTGKRPPDALSRVSDPRLNVSSELADSIPAYVVAALARGLQVSADTRMADIDELCDELFPTPGAESRSEHYAPVPPVERRREHSTARTDEPSRRPMNFSDVQSTLSDFGSRVAGSVRGLGEKVNNYISDRRARSAEIQNEPIDESDDGTPWYMNLTQWQYALLSTSLTIVVLGIIAITVFLSVRSEISGSRDEDRTLEIIYAQSDSDVVVNTSQTYAVPKLVGEQWSSALSGKYIYFQIVVLEKDFSDDYAEGVIMKQSIEPETSQPGGTVISVVVSKGSKMCKVPDIIGKTVSDAYIALDNAGLILGAQKEQYSDSYPFGTIIALGNTSVGASITRDSFVEVVVSLGPEE